MVSPELGDLALLGRRAGHVLHEPGWTFIQAMVVDHQLALWVDLS